MRIALFGNPNTGKSTVFNLLTGLRQKVGNFPGITVEKRTGTLPLDGDSPEILDVPGIYSIYPNSKEEEIVQQVIFGSEAEGLPDMGIVVVDSTNLERNLLLFTQLSDLKIPLILVVNMMDLASRKGIKIDIEGLQKRLPNTPVVSMNARVALGKDRLLDAVRTQREKRSTNEPFIPDFTVLKNHEIEAQGLEAKERFRLIKNLLHGIITASETTESSDRNRWDRWLTHPVAGYGIFALILLVIFQLVFLLASYPMDWIEHDLLFFPNLFLPIYRQAFLTPCCAKALSQVYLAF